MDESNKGLLGGYIGSVALVCLLCIFQTAGPGWTDWAGPVGGPRLRARLLNESGNAKERVAAVEVEAQHVWLHPPVPPSAYGVVTAILQYRLDSEPPVVTSDTRLRFEQLPSGNHVITVALLGVDHHLISGPAKLSVHIP